MINYVNNAYDKVLKPCDAQQFSMIVNSKETERHILGHRGGDAKAKAKLPALTYMGVFDKEKYSKYVNQCREQDIKPQGSRKAEFMRPTGLLMLDFDHVGAAPSDGVILNAVKDPAQCFGERPCEIAFSPFGRRTPFLRSAQDDTKGAQHDKDCDDRAAVIDSPVKLWEYIKDKLSAMTAPPPSQGRRERSVGSWTSQALRIDDEGVFRLSEECCEAVPLGWVHYVALAHITPSGDGLRVVLKRPKGKTIAQAQYEWCQAMELDKIGIRLDDVCKDISRLSFAPMQKEILYHNPSLLFGELPEAGDYPDEGAPSSLPRRGEVPTLRMVTPSALRARPP